MKIVIDLPAKLLEGIKIQNGSFACERVLDALYNGKILPDDYSDGTWLLKNRVSVVDVIRKTRSEVYKKINEVLKAYWEGINFPQGTGHDIYEESKDVIMDWRVKNDDELVEQVLAAIEGKQ